ncbi:MAG: glycosyltransferase [Bacteroidia bacterium]|jgi:glycosyltransferase involved in cell wall biosynthesis
MIHNKEYEITPVISIVMSVYNGAEYLKEAVESILTQTFIDFEFIIINDGSTDNSLEIIKSYADTRIIAINQENTGLARALNNGIRVARGKYIARMDADDISLPERLKLQYDFLEKYPQVVVVGGNANVIDKDGTYVYTSSQLLEWNLIQSRLPHTPFFHSSTMYRKSSFERVGGYPEIYRIEDVVFFNKLARIGELRNLSDVLIKYRLTSTAVTAKSSRSDGVIIQSIMLDAINGSITSAQKEKLKALTVNRSPSWKKSMYHLHISKKYLWNNFQPKLARKNLLKSMYYNPFLLEPLVLLLFSFMSKRLISFIYTKGKK